MLEVRGHGRGRAPLDQSWQLQHCATIDMYICWSSTDIPGCTSPEGASCLHPKIEGKVPCSALKGSALKGGQCSALKGGQCSALKGGQCIAVQCIALHCIALKGGQGSVSYMIGCI
jgi:hypothetical protein